MRNKDKIIVSKILKYIKELETFIEGYTKDQFMSDKKTINACVFNLSQIGELAGKVSDELIKETPNIEWRGIKGLRNRIVHDYDGINLNMIWNFLHKDLKSLKNEMIELLNHIR